MVVYSLLTSLAIISEGWESGAVASPKSMSGIFRFGDTFRFGDSSDLATFRFGDSFLIWRHFFRFGDTFLIWRHFSDLATVPIWRHFSDLATLSDLATVSQELVKATNPALGHVLGVVALS